MQALLSILGFNTVSNESVEDVWKVVENTPTIALADNQAIVVGGKMIFPNCKDAKLDMIMSSRISSEFVKKYLCSSQNPGTALDLGCGVGANSSLLLSHKWKVVAVDIHSKPLDVCKASIPAGQMGQITLENQDITTYEYPQVDAVVAVDVLPYISPAQLQSTMQKIFKSLNPGGKFVGTLFFKSERQTPHLFELMGKVGAHFYPSEKIAHQILTSSGFKILEHRIRDDKIAVEFLVERPV